MMYIVANSGEFIAPLCCGCWMLPLAVIGVIYGILRLIINTVQTRGAGHDGIYCAKCRFDLRGGAGWTCPECGADLTRGPGIASPRGGVIVKGVDPPMSSAVRVLVYLVGAFVPAIVIVMVVGMMIPINERVAVYATLTLPADTPVNDDFELTLDAAAQRSMFGNLKLDQLRYQDYGYGGGGYKSYTTTGAQTVEAEAEIAWDRMLVVHPWLAESLERDAIRAEFIDIFTAVCSFDKQAAEARSLHFRIAWYRDSAIDYHGVSIVIMIISIIGLLIVVILYALREGENQQRLYLENVSEVQGRYKQIVEKNLKQMGKRG